MIRAMGKAVLGIVAVVALLILASWLQTQAAADLCQRYPVGSPVADLDSLEGTTLLTRMGPVPVAGNPQTTKVTYCAAVTMCDVSCSLEIEAKVVKNASFSEL